MFRTDSHKCKLTHTPNEIEAYYPGDSKYDKFRRKLHGLTLASEDNPLAMLHLKSHSAITLERIRQLRTHPGIIHPFSRLRSWWEIYMSVVFFVSIMQIPVFISFHESVTLEMIIYETVCDVMCLIDCCVTFVSGYYDKNTKEVYLIPKMIIRHYLTGFFIFDFLSAFPFQIILSSDSETVGSPMVTLQILKLMRIKSLLKYFRQMALVVRLNEVTEMVSRFAILSLIFIQWLSCGHYLVAYLVQITHKNKRSWIYANDLVKEKIGIKYVHTLFRGVSSMFNVGYGGLDPYTTEDLLYTSFANLCGIFYVIFTITLAFKLQHVANASKAKYDEMLLQLKEFMRYKRLPRSLQNRIFEYYEFRFRKRYFREAEILSTLTGQLRQEVVLHSCRRLVEKVEFFNDLPLQLLVRIVTCLRCEIYLNNDVIVKAGTPGDAMYFIASGTVAIYSAHGQEMTHLEDGSHFGEIALVKEMEKRVASVVAIEKCELYRLNRHDFRLAVAPYPNLISRIKAIAEKRLHVTKSIDKGRTISKNEVL